MSKPTLLYIEDYPVIRKIYLDTLRKEGFDVDVATDGKQAIEKALVENYDVILLDLLLPEMNGLEFLAEYRKQSGTGRVVVLTDFDNPEALQKAKKLGVEQYWMRVNNTPHELTRRLHALLKGRI